MDYALSAGESSGYNRLPFAILLSGVAAAVLLITAAHTARAQEVYGSIYGTVTDPTGAVIPNAQVTVTDISKGTNFQAQTNGTGGYRVDHLIPDTYSVTVTAKGFSTSTVPSVTLYANTAPEVDVKLQTGGVSNTVEVTAAAPLLETDRSDVSDILDERSVENLPNLNRNFSEFEARPISAGTSAQQQILSKANKLR
jgi:hypothetical protein